MRLLLIFDLPSIDSYDHKVYCKFRNGIRRFGFVMIQWSVYMKPYNGQVNIAHEIKKIKKCVPKNGNIRILKITEQQWQEMVLLVGERNFDEIVNNNERYIKI